MSKHTIEIKWRKTRPTKEFYYSWTALVDGKTHDQETGFIVAPTPAGLVVGLPLIWRKSDNDAIPYEEVFAGVDQALCPSLLDESVHIDRYLARLQAKITDNLTKFLEERMRARDALEHDSKKNQEKVAKWAKTLEELPVDLSAQAPARVKADPIPSNKLLRITAAYYGDKSITGLAGVQMTEAEAWEVFGIRSKDDTHIDSCGFIELFRYDEDGIVLDIRTDLRVGMLCDDVACTACEPARPVEFLLRGKKGDALMKSLGSDLEAALREFREHYGSGYIINNDLSIDRAVMMPDGNIGSLEKVWSNFAERAANAFTRDDAKFIAAVDEAVDALKLSGTFTEVKQEIGSMSGGPDVQNLPKTRREFDPDQEFDSVLSALGEALHMEWDDAKTSASARVQAIVNSCRARGEDGFAGELAVLWFESTTGRCNKKPRAYVFVAGFLLPDKDTYLVLDYLPLREGKEHPALRSCIICNSESDGTVDTDPICEAKERLKSVVEERFENAIAAGYPVQVLAIDASEPQDIALITAGRETGRNDYGIERNDDMRDTLPSMWPVIPYRIDRDLDIRPTLDGSEAEDVMDVMDACDTWLDVNQLGCKVGDILESSHGVRFKVLQRNSRGFVVEHAFVAPMKVSPEEIAKVCAEPPKERFCVREHTQDTTGGYFPIEHAVCGTLDEAVAMANSGELGEIDGLDITREVLKPCGKMPLWYILDDYDRFGNRYRSTLEGAADAAGEGLEKARAYYAWQVQWHANHQVGNKDPLDLKCQKEHAAVYASLTLLMEHLRVAVVGGFGGSDAYDKTVVAALRKAADTIEQNYL